MVEFHNRVHSSPWTVPAVAGVLIVAALVATHVAHAQTVGDVTMALAAVVAGVPVVSKAVRGLTARVVAIELLVAIATVGAIVIGDYWEAAAVTFLFAVGHALETRTLAKTRSALAELIAVAPDVAVVLRGGEQVEVAAGAVSAGETVLVKNGSRVPVDGVVLDGVGALDEASITGESLPVEKVAGDHVFAGTIATGGFLRVQATGVGADTTLARIIHRVEDAQDAKAKTQRFLDRFSRWYTPAIIVLGVVLGLATRDVTLALTLLVIGCPGALVISIPVSIVSGIGRGARDGILVKGGEFLETSARITAVALDKTGTLTAGRPTLTDVVPLDDAWSDGEVLALAARAEAASEHPLAAPVIEAARAAGLTVADLPTSAEPVPGRGIVAVLDGRRVLVGNARLLADDGVDLAAATPRADELAAAGRTPVLVAVDGVAVGILAVADQVKADAAEMVRRLHANGARKVVMLTGDNARVAQAVAGPLGLDEVHAGLLPEDKLEIVQRLQREGEVVAMVGDGVNDAPALAVADIGVAMGAAGTGVAIETADIALMRDDLLALPQAVRLARRTVANMRQNIAVALVTVLALLAGVIFGGVTMAVGMLVHEASVLLVIANAMRLQRAERAQPRPAAPAPSHDAAPRAGVPLTVH